MSAPPVQAIETRYAGCRFRSRLEARFAVALDAKGLRWEYEPEGFETPCGRYLPDFRVVLSPMTTCWFEVKPDNYRLGADPDDMGQWHSVALATDLMLVVACGLDALTIVITPGHTYSHRGHPGFFTDTEIAAGRSARFEHGESGAEPPWPPPARLVRGDDPNREDLAATISDLARRHDLTTADGRVRALRKLCPVVALMPPGPDRQQLTQLLADELSMDPAPVGRAVQAAADAGRS